MGVVELQAMNAASDRDAWLQSFPTEVKALSHIVELESPVFNVSTKKGPKVTQRNDTMSSFRSHGCQMSSIIVLAVDYRRTVPPGGLRVSSLLIAYI